MNDKRQISFVHNLLLYRKPFEASRPSVTQTSSHVIKVDINKPS